jgi:hypothetical protein
MVGMLVRDENGVHALGARAAERCKAPQRLFLSQARVDEESGVLGFEQRRVARAARRKNGYSE